MKKVLIIVLAFLTISTMSVGSYAFLKNKTSNENNLIVTGSFPKLRTSVYSAAGPVFKETTKGSENQQSLSYPMWLNDASKFVVNKLTGQDLALPTPKNDFEKFQLSSLTGESRKNTIVSSNYYSWKGMALDKDKGNKEHGTTMHAIVVLENSNRGGQESTKIKLDSLKLDDISVSINQYDVFRSMVSPNEYILQRSNDEFKPGAQKISTRVMTFNWLNGKYTRTFKNDKGVISYNQSSNGDHPADEADMILFDAGGEGYYAEPGNSEKLTDQQILDVLYDRLCGKEPHAVLKNGVYDIQYQKPSPMYSVVEKMVIQNDLKCKLDRSVCEVQLLRNGTKISEESNTVIFSN